MSAQLRCRQPGCEGPASGVCIDGFTVSDCPNVSLIVEPEPAESSAYAEPQMGTGDADGSADFVPTRDGQVLDLQICDQLMRVRGGELICLLAGPSSGKTTLIAAIYEIARRGLFPSISFAGSESIFGFEQRCHLSRAVSDRLTPDTQRTRRRAGLAFLHLDLVLYGSRRDFYFADRSGETYEALISNPSSASTLPEIVRSDQIWILVDGDRLKSGRHAVIAETRRLFLALAQEVELSTKVVRILITKSDLLTENEDLDLTPLIQQTVAQLQDRSGVKIDARRISARSWETSAVSIQEIEAALVDRSSAVPPFRAARTAISDPRGSDRLLNKWGLCP